MPDPATSVVGRVGEVEGEEEGEGEGRVGAPAPGRRPVPPAAADGRPSGGRPEIATKSTSFTICVLELHPCHNSWPIPS